MNSEAEIRGWIADLAAQRREYGRADLPFEIKVVCSDVFDLEGYRRLEDAGVTDLIGMPWLLYGGDPSALDTKTKGIERFADDVIAKLA